MSGLSFSCVVLLLVAALTGEAQGHDVSVCDNKPYDYVLSNLQITDQGHGLGIGYLDVVFPPMGEPEDNVINCILITDLKPEIGATASITNGTIGSTSVGIHLESPFSKGFSFSIKFIGHKE